MRSTRRGRDRSRLRTSKPVNMMFSNGLGVCKYGNAGMKAVCLNKTREIVIAVPSLKIIQQVTTPTTNPITFKISTNIVGATMTISNGAGLTLTAPSPAKSVYGDQTITLDAILITATYPAVKLILTGGVTKGRGTSTHTVSSVTLEPFDVDTVPPVIALLAPANALTSPSPYMNLTDTPTNIALTSTKAGTLSFSPVSAGVALSCSPTNFASGNVGAGGQGFNINTTNNIPEGAYPEQSVILTDDLGNASDPLVIAAAGTLANGIYTAPNNAWLIDKTNPTPVADGAQQNLQTSGDTKINFILTPPTSTTAPYKAVLALDVAAIAITGVGNNNALNGITPVSVSVQQQTVVGTGEFIEGWLIIDLPAAMAATVPGDANEITVSYDPSNVNVDANKIQDEAENKMVLFNSIAITVSP